MKKIEDVKNIEVKKDYFVNKQLIELLNRIKPAIKLVSVRSGWAEQGDILYLSLLIPLKKNNITKKENFHPESEFL